MKSELIRRLYKRQQGFTLIEIIVGVAISSLILLVTVACIHQIFFSGYNVREDMRSIQYVQNTGGWLRLDALKSQIIVPGDNPGTGENDTMTFYWAGAARKDGGNDCLDYYEVSYYINSEELRRKEHITTNVYDSDGNFIETIENESTTFISDNISDLTVVSDNVSLIVSITSLVDDAETQKVYEVLPRAIK